MINQLQVDGFGWIRRDTGSDPTLLKGEADTLAPHLLEPVDDDLRILLQLGFCETEVRIMEELIKPHISAWAIGQRQAYLAHGDFDLTHIFYEDSQYSGIIDFGEIRGMCPLYDLGHFKLQARNQDSICGLEHVLQGYREVTPIGEKELMEIDLLSLYIGIRTLSRISKRPWGSYHDHLQVTIKEQLHRLPFNTY